MKKIYSLTILLFIAFSSISISGFSQNAGDFRSRADGDWNDQAVWQRYNGSKWQNNQGYPGQNTGTGNVTIIGSDDITITASVPNAIGSLVIGDGSGTNETLTYDGTSAFTLTVSGSVTLNDGNVFITNATNPKTHILNIGGNFTIGSTSVFTPLATPDDELEVVFNGNSNQTIGGTISSIAFQDLRINKPSGTLTLSVPSSIAAAASATVFGTLTLTSGVIVTTATNLLTLNNGTTVAGSSSTSFVEGPLRKVGNTAFTFPVGKSGNGIHPISISAPANATNAFTATYYRQPASSRAAIGSPLTVLSNTEYWGLSRDAGTSTVDVTITWNADSPNGSAYVTTLSGLTVGSTNGSSAWTLAPGTSTTISGNTTAGTVLRTGISNFGYFALASLIAGGSPLPVMYDGVKAYAKNTGVQVEWSNLTERDIISYYVERSSNGSEYSEIAAYQPKSNRNDKASYTYFDASPVAGANYYRIRAVELGGKNIYSKTLRVELSGTASVNTYPNPVTGRQMTISLTGMREGSYNVRIVNANGQDVFKKQIQNRSSATSEMIELPSSAKPGIYTIVISNENFNTSKLFIVK